MLPTLLNRFVPASLYGGETARPVLARIDGEIRRAESTASAAAVLENAKPDLYARLRDRFQAPAAQALTLRILNLFLARFHFQARSVSVGSRPFGLVVDPSNVCQLACPGCVHSHRAEEFKLFDWPNGTLSEEKFSALLRLYGPYAVGIYFCSYGEPLLNLATPRLIRQAKAYMIGTALSTSFSVRKFDAEAYVESGLDILNMSIDGATQPVYEKFRRNGSLELVLENIRRLAAAKRELGKQTPVMSWNFLAFEHNVHEIPLAERMARELGVNRFRVVNPFDVGWDDPAVRPAQVKSAMRRLDWFSVASRPDNWNPFADQTASDAIAHEFEKSWFEKSATVPAEAAEPSRPGHTCHWLYKNMVVDATGRITPCCGAPRPDINLVFGNLDGDNPDPYNSARYREARAWFSAGMPALDDGAAAKAAHCTRCEWDHTAVNIGAPEIRRYFRAADAAFFDRASIRLLADW